jgi:periplasmic divalent cation tolerance protein
MKATDKLVVLVTSSTATEADHIAFRLVEERLAACVNVLESPVRSTYRWQGKVETATEYLLVMKTSRAKFAALRDRVTALHSYDTPEVIALPIQAGAEKYLAWLGESLGEPPASPRRPARKENQR